MLNWIRPKWLRVIVLFIVEVLIGSVCGIVVIRIAYLVAEFVPPFRTSDPLQQQATAYNLLGIGAVALVVVLLPWYVYSRSKHARANAFHREGLRLDQQGDYAGALVAYDRALEIQPKFVGSWTNKSIVLTHLRRYEEALAAIAQALSINPQHPKAWLNKGVILNRMGRYEEALAATEKALSLDRRNPITWNNKADILCESLKRYDEAITTCDEARRKHIETPGLWAIKGVALHAVGRDDEARAAYERALAYPTDDVVSWAAHAKALAGVRRYDEALTAYDQALTFRPDEPRLWSEKAAVLRALARDDEAQEDEARADELDR